MTIDLAYCIIALVAFSIGILPFSHYVIKYFARDKYSTNIPEKENLVKEEHTDQQQYSGILAAYTRTGRWYIPVVLTIVDGLKGYAAFTIGYAFGGLHYGATAGVIMLLGHCFSPLRQYRGGRGIAVAIGALLGVNYLPIILFILMFATGYGVIRRDIHVGFTAAIIGTMLLMYTAPDFLLYKLSVVDSVTITTIKAMVFMMMITLFIRQIEPMRALFRSLQNEDESAL